MKKIKKITLFYFSVITTLAVAALFVPYKFSLLFIIINVVVSALLISIQSFEREKTQKKLFPTIFALIAITAAPQLKHTYDNEELAKINNHLEIKLDALSAQKDSLESTMDFLNNNNNHGLTNNTSSALAESEFYKGGSYLNDGLYKFAENSFKKTIELSPKASAAHNNLGITHYRKKEYDEAIEVLKKAIKMNHSDFALWNTLGLNYYANGQYMKAINAFDQSIKINASSIQAINNKGLSLLEMDKTLEAMKLFNHALSLAPKNSMTLNNIGTLHLKINNNQQALDLFEESLKSEPGNIISLLNICQTANILKKYTQAIEACSKYISINPKENRAFHFLGDAYLNQGDYEAAIRNYDKFLSKEPSHKTVWMKKAYALNRLEKFSESNAIRIKLDELI